jgi:hypothetical protein
MSFGSPESFGGYNPQLSSSVTSPLPKLPLLGIFPKPTSLSPRQLLIIKTFGFFWSETTSPNTL